MQLPRVHFFGGLPSKEDLEQWSESDKHNFIVLDDLMQKAAKIADVAYLFCLYSHHLNFTVFFLVQKLISNGPQFRNISLNVHYFILFKNARDELQVKRLACQMFPSRVDFFHGCL